MASVVIAILIVVVIISVLLLGFIVVVKWILPLPCPIKIPPEGERTKEQQFLVDNGFVKGNQIDYNVWQIQINDDIFRAKTRVFVRNHVWFLKKGRRATPEEFIILNKAVQEYKDSQEEENPW